MTLKSILFALLLACLAPLVHAQTLSADLLAEADIVVDPNGNGDYLTVQAGLDAVPDSSSDWTVVLLRNGVYEEKVILNHRKTKVILVGENVDSTIITHDDYGDLMLPGGHTFSTYTFRADPHDFQAYNLTFANPATAGQAVAFHSNGDRQILFHCKLLGYQDTYFDNFRTRRYVKDCFIEGAVDYIFGFGVTLFDSCQLNTTDNGYITAAATPEHYEFGYVFRNCYLTSPGRWQRFYLGRPWFPYANTAFLQSWFSRSVIPAGWQEWGGRSATCLYREYQNRGLGARLDFRVEWSRQMDSIEAQRYVIDTIFAAANFPSDLGPAVDSTELWSMRQRFADAGYPERADTILYAGRDSWPSYPTDDWSPQFYAPIYDLIRSYTTPFVDSIQTSTTNLAVPKGPAASLQLYRPAQGGLILHNAAPLRGPALLTLRDLSGRAVWQHRLPPLSPGRQTLPTEALSLPPGLYLYQIETQDQVSTGKILWP